MPIKILFINTVNPAKTIETAYPSLGLGYLASSLRKEFGSGKFEFRVIDRDVELTIKEFKPDIVGISSVTQNYNRAIEYAQIAKKYDLPVLIGGVHISLLPASLVHEMDVGVMLEGEDTICDLMRVYMQHKSFPAEKLSGVDGIIYWKNGQVTFTKPRALITPLDKIPMPARDLLNIEPNTYIFSSRGCPYRCTFCASSRFWDKVRLFSAEYVVDEIELLVKKYNVKSISFHDDLFTISKKRIERMIQLLDERKLLGKVDFTGALRANIVSDEIAILLKKMGINGIGLGFESGNEETLRYLKGEDVTVEDNENAARILKKHGIRVGGSFIIGAPKETKQNILKTYNFIKRSKLDNFVINVLTALPGTPVWDYAKKRGLVSDTMDWSKLNVDYEENWQNAIILSETLTKNEIHELYKKFGRYHKRKEVYDRFKRAIKHPGKIWRRMQKKLRTIGEDYAAGR